MKKILLTLFLFFVFCIPTFAKGSISVPNVTISQAKEAVKAYMIKNGCSFTGRETSDSLDFYKPKLIFDDDEYQKDYNMYLFMKKEFPNKYFIEPDKYESKYHRWTNIVCRVVFSEKNGITITADELTPQELKDMQKTVFTGYYTYNIEYKIPLLKRHVVISDTLQTNYTGSNRIGNEKKIVKINDKNVKDYTKKEIEDIFNNCLIEKLKLESDNGKVYYLIHTFIEPTNKQYL